MRSFEKLGFEYGLEVRYDGITVCTNEIQIQGYFHFYYCYDQLSILIEHVKV